MKTELSFVGLCLIISCIAASSQTLDKRLFGAAPDLALSTLAASDPAGQYPKIKQAFDTYYRGRAPRIVVQKYYEISDCADTVAEYDQIPNFNTLSALLSVAIEAVRLSYYLPQMGYPPMTWQPVIQRYESREIEQIRATMNKQLPEDEYNNFETATLGQNRAQMYRDLVSALSPYRKAHPSLARVDVGNLECGGLGMVDVNVKTQPPGGVIFYIPLFFYELCKAQNLDPDDRNYCDQWQEVIEGETVAMLGDYRYVATWPDGAARRGRLSFNDASEFTRTVVLTKP